MRRCPIDGLSCFNLDCVNGCQGNDAQNWMDATRGCVHGWGQQRVVARSMNVPIDVTQAAGNDCRMPLSVFGSRPSKAVHIPNTTQGATP